VESASTGAEAGRPPSLDLVFVENVLTGRRGLFRNADLAASFKVPPRWIVVMALRRRRARHRARGVRGRGHRNEAKGRARATAPAMMTRTQARTDRRTPPVTPPRATDSYDPVVEPMQVIVLASVVVAVRARSRQGTEESSLKPAPCSETRPSEDLKHSTIRPAQRS